MCVDEAVELHLVDAFCNNLTRLLPGGWEKSYRGIRKCHCFTLVRLPLELLLRRKMMSSSADKLLVEKAEFPADCSVR